MKSVNSITARGSLTSYFSKNHTFFKLVFCDPNPLNSHWLVLRCSLTFFWTFWNSTLFDFFLFFLNRLIISSKANLHIEQLLWCTTMVAIALLQTNSKVAIPTAAADTTTLLTRARTLVFSSGETSKFSVSSRLTRRL